MAAAFLRAGFEPWDVHMTDLLSGRLDLSGFKGLAACGGFSYGDVLGAGGGWAATILNNDRLSAMFRTFFERGDTFGLGVCNGCQMMSRLRSPSRGLPTGRSSCAIVLNSLKHASFRLKFSSPLRFFSPEWPVR